MTLYVQGITPNNKPQQLAEAWLIGYHDTYAILADAFAEAMDRYKVKTLGLELAERFNDVFERALNHKSIGGIHGIQLDEQGMMLRIVRTLAPTGEIAHVNAQPEKKAA